MGLETYLRKMRESADEPTRTRYRAVPLYLQHLFREATHLARNDAHNYTRLINALITLDSMTVVSLNYDTLIDDPLRQVIDPAEMKEYVGQDRFALIKWHGSWNWRRSIRGMSRFGVLRGTGEPEAFDYPEAVAEMGDDLVQNLGVVELAPGAESIEDVRYGGAGEVYYPALSVPVGTDDERMCPEDHEDRLVADLQRDPVFLLIVGYSGRDQSLMTVISKAMRGREFAHAEIVSYDKPRAGDVRDRLDEAGIGYASDTPFNGNFTSWAPTGTAYVEKIRKLVS